VTQSKPDGVRRVLRRPGRRDGARPAPTPATQKYFATTAKGLEGVLAAELAELGARDVENTRAGASFSGALEVAYRACLWSRVASRVLLPLASFRADTPEALYDGVRTIRWWEHLGPRGTLAVDCSISQSRLTHSHFAALKTKDAIVDQLRDRSGERPSIDVARPDVRVNVYLHRDRATVAIDLAGESLHRRGYRERGLAAPLKENLAAGLLLLAEWKRRSAERAPFVDPMCGSGTLPIEAALIAADVAPGLARAHFGFLRWRAHDTALWKRLLAEAEERRVRDPKRLPPIRGYDADARAVRTALTHLEGASVRGLVHIEKRTLAECAALPGRDSGVLFVNPPYGERIGDIETLAPLYAEIGDVLRRRFIGWTGYILAGNRELAKHIGLRTARRVPVYNGAIECRLLEFPIAATAVQSERGPGWRKS